jgi:O-antigen/teichoic acid export membrane protein
MRSHLRLYFATSTTQIAVIVANLVGTVIIARGMSVGERGLYVTVTTAAMLIASVASLGYTSGQIRSAQVRNVESSILWKNALVFSGAWGMLVFSVSTLLYFAVSDSWDYSILWVLGLLSIPGLLSAMALRQLLLLSNDLIKYNISFVLTSVIQLLAVWLGYATGQLSAVFVVGLFLLTNLIPTGYILLTVTEQKIGRFEKSSLVTTVKDGLGFFPAIILLTLLTRVDILIVGFLLDSESVSYYSASVFIAEFVLVAVEALVVIFTKKITDRVIYSHLQLSRIIAVGLLIGIVTSVFIGFISPWVIPVTLGTEYLASLTSLWILLPGMVAFGIANLIGLRLSILNLKKVIILTAILTLLVNTSLDFLLIPKFGIEGAAAATSISYVLHFVVFVSLLLRNKDTKSI